MTSSILRSLATLCLAATVSSVALKAQGCISAAIPFNFTVGKQSLPAGDYCVQPIPQNRNILLLRNLDRRSSTMTMTIPADDAKQNVPPVLIFKVYGNSHFLYQVAASNHVWQLNRSAAEEVLIARKAQPNPVTVAAAFGSK